MTPRSRQSSAPGSGRGGAGRRPTTAASAGSSRTTRSTTRAADTDGGGDGSGGASRASLTGRAAILLLVLAVLVVSYASSTRAWLRQRGEINDLNAQIVAQQAEVDTLQKEKRRWNDPAYIRAMARERLGWVMPGEIGYRVIGDDGEILADSTNSLSEPVATADHSTDEWWDEAWGTVLAAAEDPAVEAAASDDEQQQPVDHIGRNPMGHNAKQGRGGASSGRTPSR